jgi:hypothetical protein
MKISACGALRCAIVKPAVVQGFLLMAKDQIHDSNNYSENAL